MIRLLLLLCAGLYLTLMVFGQDHGQKRYGLMLADSIAASKPAAAPVADTKIEPETVVFIPAQPAKPPVVAAPVVADPVVNASLAQPSLPDNAVETAAPQIADGLLYTVAADQANVRGGPGRNFAVLDSLQQGEQVLVVIEEQPVEGWSRIRIEGDGIEGYVATRLLTRVE